MYSLSDGRLICSATDLTNHLACPHLTQVKLGVARGERGRGRKSQSAHAELVRERGQAHEDEQLQRLAAEAGGEYVDLARERELGPDGKTVWPPRREWLEAGHEATAQAMRDGAPLIFQAMLFDGHWQGIADFLRRVDGVPSELGDYSYEVLDSKLAKDVKPHVVHQLALYSRMVASIQGAQPEHAHVVLGDGRIEPLRLADFGALHRRVVRRFETILELPTDAGSFPEPVAHCAICDLQLQCSQQLREVDHLSFVARAARGDRDRLTDGGLATLEALATSAPDVAVDDFDAARLTRLRSQAELQLAKRQTGELQRRHLPAERAVGYAILPQPDPADLFFDLEGDPYVGADGIEYLWGWSSVPGGAPLPGLPASVLYDCRWAHDEAEEQAALEAFVDLVVERRREHPALRVYHYAPHEKSKLLGLAVKYGTREAEVDQLVRDGVLVDLYAVVSRALQVGEESYSLKALEPHHRFVREEKSVREGGGSIVAYEHWRAGEGDELLESIRAYNEEDCRSTLSLRDWLWHELRPEAARELGADWDALRVPEPEEARGEPEWVAPLAERRDRLHEGLSEDPAGDDTDQAERRLLGDLLLYHRREEKPQWWEQIRLSELAPDDLIDEREALGGLEPAPGSAPEPVGGRSKAWLFRMRMPVQEFKEPGQVLDPRRWLEPDADVPTVAIHEVDAARGELTLSRQGKYGDAEQTPLPQALIPTGLPPTKLLREALAELGDEVLASGSRFRAVRAMLRREAPQLAPGVPLGDSTEALCAATLALQDSVLPVQGPPGTGKTYNAARMIVAALQAGKRVGITAQSHAAVCNVLRAVESYADEVGLTQRVPGMKGFYKGDPEVYESPTGLVHVANDNAGALATKTEPAPQLVAGTAWLFARAEHWSSEPQFDLLFVDEAGQFSLANACAAGMAARSIVLLGDPQQLPQVTQGTHPAGADASVLEHMLGDHATVPDDRGVLLATSWRMHPAVCAWVSEASYEGRLHSEPQCAMREIQADGEVSGAGLRVLEVEHEGRSQKSPEEADAIAAACRQLLSGGTVTEPVRDTPAELRDLADMSGLVTHPLRPRDILVVAPYNLAVDAISRAVPEGVRVGTVDKFQGQEAPVVFYALTCSSADDVPRGLDFLFDPNRCNVAISRAQALAVLVHSPRLLDAECRTLEVMRRVSGVCGLAETADVRGAGT